jgi:hypothetical protein
MDYKPNHPNTLIRRFGWVLVLILFSLMAFMVNPFREMPLEDDWAYARTVEHLYETGEYKPHNWLSANMPFQAYWALLFCFIGGFSFSMLRLSTLVLSIFGLLAFYGLSREHGLNRSVSALLTLCIASSPLYFRFSLNFMTDVPFLSTITIALYLYTRALRLESWWLMIIASLAASATILTRQFGTALVAALFILWMLDQERWKRAAWYVSGLVAPTLAVAWQLYEGLLNPNWAAKWTSARQVAYITERTFAFLIGFIWRPLVIMHYMAWFLIPLVLVALTVFVWQRDETDLLKARIKTFRLRTTTGLMILAMLFVWGIVYGAVVRGKPWLMPYLPWNFSGLEKLGSGARLAATFITFTGAVLFTRMIILRIVGQQLGPLERQQRLLDLTALFSLLAAVVFVVFGDEYLLVLIPFVSIAVGNHLRDSLEKLAAPVIVACLILMVVGSYWTAGIMSRAEVVWVAAKKLQESGVEASQIFSGWTWAGYHRFDDYVARVEPTQQLTSGDLFGRWIREQKEEARYWVVRNPHNGPSGEPWTIIDEHKVDGVRMLQHNVAYVIRRDREKIGNE